MTNKEKFDKVVKVTIKYSKIAGSYTGKFLKVIGTKLEDICKK